jgi:ribonuclease-3 family protein
MEEANKEITTGSYGYFKEVLGIQKVNPQNYSPLALAYIGDSVFDVMIRTMEVSRVNMQANKYHKDVSKIVCATAQAKMILAIEDRLREEEQAIFKRGRNAKSYTKAKNASMVDYRNATGFEALLGYLYLQEDFKRLTDVVKMGLEVLEQDE